MVTTISVNQIMATVLIALAAIWEGLQGLACRRLEKSPRARTVCSIFLKHVGAIPRPPHVVEEPVTRDHEPPFIKTAAHSMCEKPNPGRISGSLAENKLRIPAF